MHTKSRIYVVAALVAVATAGFSLNAAAEILYTDWQVGTTTDQGTNDDWNPLTFDRYNAADYGGYALHNVQLELEGVGYATYDGTDTFTADITIAVDDPTTGDFLVAVESKIDDTDLQGDIATDSKHYVGSKLTPDLINFFSGTGTVELNTLATIVFSGDSIRNLNSSYNATVRVRYSYAVPEPASMLLVATGLLLGGGFVTRRRKPGLRALQDA